MYISLKKVDIQEGSRKAYGSMKHNFHSILSIDYLITGNRMPKTAMINASMNDLTSDLF